MLTGNVPNVYGFAVTTNAVIDPRTVEGNWITVRIGGYYTMYPLPESTDEAIALISAETAWQEVGERFARLQRTADRSQNA